jgi:hypothetical protein
LHHREDLVVRRSGRQKEGRREAPRQALERSPRLRVVGRLLSALDYFGRASEGAAEVATASIYVERVGGVLSLRRRPAQSEGLAWPSVVLLRVVSRQNRRLAGFP